MRSWSLRAGRFFGIDVFIHWTFWILIVWILLMHVGGGHGLSQAFSGVLFVFALFLCVVLHEFGHALVARRFGVTTKDITLYPIGGIASLESIPEKPGQELLVGLAGPVVNLIIAALLWAYLSSTGQLADLDVTRMSHDMAQFPFLANLFYANIILALFNLVPAFPMDGGRVLRGVLSFFVDKVNATRVAAGLGQFLAIVFVFLGFFYNFWLVFIGLFIFLGASREAAHESMKSALAGLTVRDALMTRFTLLAPSDTLGRAVDALLNSQESEFVVADQGKPVGILRKNDIIRGLSEQGKDARVSAFMNTDFVIAGPQMKLQDLFQSLSTKAGGAAVVVENDSLTGLIDLENIEERLMVKEILGKHQET